MDILLIDNDSLARLSTKLYLRNTFKKGTIYTLSKVIEIQKLIKLLHTSQIELIIFSASIDINNTLADIQILKAFFQKSKIVVLSDFQTNEIDKGWHINTADITLNKKASPLYLFKFLHEFISQTASPIESHPYTRLSKRQTQLIPLIEHGMSNEDIANTLNISQHTVKVHIYRLFKKANVSSRVQLINWVHMYHNLIYTGKSTTREVSGQINN